MLNGVDNGSTRREPTVFVVDDEPGIRRSLRRFLEDSGYRVVEAADVDGAVDALRQVPVDAVVLDVRLPDQRGWKRSGLDVLTFLRLHDELADIPVMVWTGYRLSEEEADLIKKHGASVFYKPDGYATLMRHLGRVTEHDRGDSRSPRIERPGSQAPHLPRE